MKNLLVLLLTLSLFYACTPSSDSNEYTVNGTIENADSLMAVLQKRVDADWVDMDSVLIQNGSFMFQGSVEMPEMCYIKVGEQRRRIVFFLENSNIDIAADVDSLDKAEISGSVLQDKYLAYYEGAGPYRNKIRGLFQMADSLSAIGKESMVDSLYEIYSEELDAYTKSVITENLDNPLGPYLATSTYYSDEKLEELDALVKQFDPAVAGSAYYKQLSEMVRVWKKVAVGQPAIDFTQNDTTGTPVTLSSLKGQYVLIDFWASWCGPCRAENPNVVKLYNELHDKGFEIIGVSFDTSRERWLQAIEDDNLTWYHVSDLGGWGNAVGDMYSVRSIPHTILLDKEGIIIGKNLRGEELRDKLEGLLL